MNEYRIIYSQTERRLFTVDAESEEAARLAWRRGAGQDEFLDVDTDQKIIRIEVEDES